MHPIMHSPLSFRLYIRTANCTRLHSTPERLPLWSLITMFMTKSYSQFLKLSNDGGTISKALHYRSTWSPITGTCNIFQRPKSSHISKHDGLNIFPPSISLFDFSWENMVPNPTHLLDDGTSILKRGVATMPLLTCRITTRFSLLSNWHRPSKLHPYLSQSFAVLSLWMLTLFILTLKLDSEKTRPRQNTSIICRPIGLSIPTVYYDTSAAFMSRTSIIFDYVFSKIRTITPLQDISVRQRHYTRSDYTITGRAFPSTSKTTANRASLVPAPNLCAINLTGYSNSFRFPTNPGTRFPWIS